MQQTENKIVNWVENGDADVAFRCSDTKPNVFLIGDSIRRGYCATVKNAMRDVAEVFYPDTNCRSSQYIIFSLRAWKNSFDRPEKVDLIQFNCGHWDAAHWCHHPLPLTSPEEYKKNLQIIVDLLHGFFPNARLVLATTTPMNPDGGDVGGGNPRTNADLDLYNRIAVEIAEKNGIPVNDLNGFMRSWGSECFKDTCHLTPEAFARLGEEVARVLAEKLGES
ncbi:MAG: hypothetical protein IKC69_07125 [Clostridia bacterium]|nr:hypothetical protein [Clostridia bacterium]